MPSGEGRFGGASSWFQARACMEESGSQRGIGQSKLPRATLASVLSGVHRCVNFRLFGSMVSSKQAPRAIEGAQKQILPGGGGLCKDSCSCPEPGSRRLSMGHRMRGKMSWDEPLQTHIEQSLQDDIPWHKVAQDRAQWRKLEASYVARVLRRTPHYCQACALDDGRRWWGSCRQDLMLN